MLRRRIFEAEHGIFRDSVRRFLQREVAPHRDRWRQAGIVDRDIYRKAGEQGLLLMWAPEEFGGAGVTDFRYEQVLIEEMARHGDSGLFLSLHSRLVGPYLGELGTGEQKRRWLPGCVSGETILGIAMTEPNTGSDLAAIRSHAEDRGDHFLLNGQKTYISNGINGDLFVVAARTDSQSPYGISLFLVEGDMPGFRRGRNLAKMGLKSQDTAELFFDDVRLSRDHLLGEVGQGFYYLMRFLAEERLIGAVSFLAAAQAALDLTLDYVRERQAFGRPVAAFQNTRFKMAEMRTCLDAAQALVDRCVEDFGAGELSAELAAEAKLHCSELQGRVVDECVQLHGGAGYMDEYPISRMYTDARVSRIYAGTSEIMKEIIARSMGLEGD